MFGFGPHYTKKNVGGLERVEGRATKIIQDWKACHMRKGSENWVYSALGIEGSGGTLLPCSSI